MLIISKARDYRQNLVSVPADKRVVGEAQRKVIEITLGIGPMQFRLMLNQSPGFVCWYGYQRIFGINY